MSGIVGLFSLDDAPVDERILRRLTKRMLFRGPDGQGVWCGSRAGLGCTMLHTTCDAPREGQPCSLNQQLRIVADARIDGRSELLGKLRSAGNECRQGATDAELILHAYRAWGEECVQHLLGDFSFAIWDAARERVFCARDHLGVKPFFYARAGSGIVFSNTLNIVREHPGITHELNDGAIADFLMFGVNQDQASTAFAGIQRLPPAHRLSISPGKVQVERYWDLPSGEELRYRKPAEYVDDFVERLNTAVSDRMRSDRIGVLMSGGLDSTTIAATAKAQLSGRQSAVELRAYTCVYDRLFSDGERHFSTLAASFLGIPVHYLVADDYALFERWRSRELMLPEPVDEPLAAVYFDQTRQMAENCRVALTGWDGDALFGESARRSEVGVNTFVNMARRVAAMARRALSERQWPQLDLRARLARRLQGSREAERMPPQWIDAALVKRLNLQERWREIQANGNSGDGRHVEAHRVLKSPLFTNLLESYDPGVTRIAVEARHPLLDLRVADYVLSLPVSPWCVDKTLLRMAMRDRLPEAVRLRPKSPLAGDPVIELLQRDDALWVDAIDADPALSRFVDTAEVPSISGAGDPDQIWTNLRPLCLNLWLQQASVPALRSRKEEPHEVA